MMGELILFYKSRSAIGEDRKALYGKFKDDLDAIGGNALAKDANGISSHAVAERAFAMAQIRGAHWMNCLSKARKQLKAAAPVINDDDAGVRADRLLKSINEFNNGIDRLNRLEKRSARFFAGAR